MCLLSGMLDKALQTLPVCGIYFEHTHTLSPSLSGCCAHTTHTTHTCMFAQHQLNLLLRTTCSSLCAPACGYAVKAPVLDTKTGLKMSKASEAAEMGKHPLTQHTYTVSTNTCPQIWMWVTKLPGTIHKNPGVMQGGVCCVSQCTLGSGQATLSLGHSPLSGIQHWYSTSVAEM